MTLVKSKQVVLHRAMPLFDDRTTLVVVDMQVKFAAANEAWMIEAVDERILAAMAAGAGVVFLNFFSPLSTISEATEVAFGADHEKAQIIPDTFHMFLGESNLNNFNHLQGDFITIFQFSDCPKGVEPHAKHEDKIRVLPGDGVLPLVDTLSTLKKINYTGPLSLELYNPEYRAREPKAFLAEAIKKTIQVAEKGSR